MNLRLPVILLAAAAAAAAAEPALFSPAMITLRTQLSNELAAIRARLGEPTAAALRDEIARWDGELAQRRRTRNVRGIAIAEDALQILRKALEQAAQGGRVELPTEVRRDLTDEMARLRERLAALDMERENRQREAELEAAGKFRDAAARAGVEVSAEPEALAARFRTWLTESPPAAPPPPPAGGPTNGPAAPLDATPAAPSRATEPPPEHFAQSRLGANWVRVGTWKAGSHGPDVFEVQLFGPPGRRTGSKPNPIVGRTIEWVYEQERAVEPGDYSWRLRRVDSADIVDVIEWPSRQNDGRLSFRTRMPVRVPSETVFEIEYSSAALIAVPVKTDPPGARVHVNGQPYRDGAREAVTPCTLHLPSGTYAIRLSLEGYQDTEVGAFRVISNAAIAVRLAPIKNLPGRTVTVDPQKIWADTGIAVKKGDRVRLAVEGEWGCGRQGELAGPAGYDPSLTRFSHYYLDPRNSPRQLEGAPYGCLLARIGTNRIANVGNLRGFIASDDGPLLFDINEVADPAWRRDNRGSLKIKVIVQGADAR